MAKSKNLDQLNLTVVALVALVAIVGLVALVLNAGSFAHMATGNQLASAQNTAGHASGGAEFGMHESLPSRPNLAGDGSGGYNLAVYDPTD